MNSLLSFFKMVASSLEVFIVLVVAFVPRRQERPRCFPTLPQQHPPAPDVNRKADDTFQTNPWPTVDGRMGVGTPEQWPVTDAEDLDSNGRPICFETCDRRTNQ